MRKNRHLIFLLLTLIGILLFSLSFPGLLNREGISFISFFSLIPLFVLTKKITYKEGIFYGFLYGSGSYLLFNYWLKAFDPVSFSIAPSIIGFYYVILFLLLIYINKNIKKHTYILTSLSWLLYEVFKGENAIGYTYGTIAHSMYKTHIFTGIADITGVYIISLIIVFPSAFIADIFTSSTLKYSKNEKKLVTLIYLLIMTISILYTKNSKIDYRESGHVKVALIQHNLDSWAHGSNLLYRETLDILLNLTKKSLREKPDVVIWSETAFVPAIEWHKEFQSNSFRLELVNEMEAFIQGTGKDFIIGANETIGNEDEFQTFYNSSYHYSDGQIINKYRKIKLVPFTEHFPLPDVIPGFKEYIKSIGGKDISPGNEQINFNFNNINFTPLICYEDTFSSIARDGILNNGDIIVNMTNDAWSKEEACSMQHLSASIFRSIENRRSFIRVGTGGFTTIIDPNGLILHSIPILTEDYLVSDVPIYNASLTFYTKHGDLILQVILIIYLITISFHIIKSTLYALQLIPKSDLNQVE
ncbi:MAG: apolipoprotein N-acyltransferase [Spirochaetales bacterium]|nr:apolipoprotein N-acyltransferase [Spirochaetales bacterium]